MLRLNGDIFMFRLHGDMFRSHGDMFMFRLHKEMFIFVSWWHVLVQTAWWHIHVSWWHVHVQTAWWPVHSVVPLTSFYTKGSNCMPLSYIHTHNNPLQYIVSTYYIYKVIGLGLVVNWLLQGGVSFPFILKDMLVYNAITPCVIFWLNIIYKINVIRF